MITYICHAMKIWFWKYSLTVLALFVILGNARSQSAIELMEDTAAWLVDAPHVGGATAEEAMEAALFNERTNSTLRLLTIADSLAHIPAFDLYCGWDTQNLFREKNAREHVDQGMKFILSHDVCDFVYPTNGEITSVFGPRWGRMHYGLDIDLETGDDVFAAFEGMVRVSQYHSSYGNVVVIRHNNGLETLYAHMSQRKVKPGDHVEAGDIIGLGGNTGRSYGAHLHFEIRFMGEAVDPNLIVDPAKKNLRDWEIVLEKEHFDHKALAVDSKVIDARKSGSSKYHIVKKGETLSSIARKNKTSVEALCKLNKIKKTSTLQLGQKIRYK